MVRIKMSQLTSTRRSPKASEVPSGDQEPRICGDSLAVRRSGEPLPSAGFRDRLAGPSLLDEIGELDTSLQVKLLRALQERCIERLGSTESIPIDVRVVASTNRDLDSEVRAGRFRADLYYRINVVLIQLPPLRDRREDIPLLAKTFLHKISSEAGGERSQLQLSRGALAAFQRHPLPGDVRELDRKSDG